MLFVRREVVSPGAASLPLPKGAVAASRTRRRHVGLAPQSVSGGHRAAADDRAVRPMETKRYSLDYLSFCRDAPDNAAGRLFPLAQKRPGARQRYFAAAVLVGGDLKKLPQAKIAAARLIVPVAEGHSMAPGELGAVFLDAQVEKSASCNFDKLDPIAGTVVVPQQPRETPTYQPARPLAIDVTRAVKEITAGRKFSRLALRIVPDRGVDDGYTVRCRISKIEPIVLEIDTYPDSAK